jgi:hypothetical protein
MREIISKKYEAENSKNRGYILLFQGLFVVERELDNNKTRNYQKYFMKKLVNFKKKTFSTDSLAA